MRAKKENDQHLSLPAFPELFDSYNCVEHVGIPRLMVIHFLAIVVFLLPILCW